MNQTFEERMSPLHRYERGLVLKRVQIFDKAIEEFQQAATDPQYAGEAHVQIGFCLRSAGRYEEAIAAFRQALTWPPFSSERSVHILYLMGRALESLGRYAETLEIYRWIIREDHGYLDVVHRIEDLSSGRDPDCRRQPADQSWVGDMLKSCRGLRLHILYLLGRALESLGRYAETLEIYRWIIREDRGYLDVVHRIEDLSSGRDPVCRRQPADQSWVRDMLKSCQGLLKIK
ncbi:MAG TPA: tetratricopeptide repeat protein [Nitrospiraceae bacterium]|jgi:tetratricopeptide (TPR) repeat protein|nr:tetratricopeptide repeat protein [Nitrospiraceae bacterium]